MSETPLSPHVKPPAARLAAMAAAIALPVAGLAALLVSGQPQRQPTAAQAEAVVAPMPDPAGGVALDADVEQPPAPQAAPVSIHPPVRIMRAAPREVPMPVQQPAKQPVAPQQPRQEALVEQPQQPTPTPKIDRERDCQQRQDVQPAPPQRTVARPWHISRHGAPPSMPSAPPATADPAPATAAEET